MLLSPVFWKHGMEISIVNDKNSDALIPFVRVKRWSLLYSVLLLRVNAFLMWTYFQLNNLVHGQQQGLIQNLSDGQKECRGYIQLRKFEWAWKCIL